MSRPARSDKNKQGSSKTLRFLESTLKFKVPIVGGWISRAAASQLAERVYGGDEAAAKILAKFIGVTGYPASRHIAIETIKNTAQQDCLNGAWEAWVETRNQDLFQLLIMHNRSATTPATARVFSLLALGQIQHLKNASGDLVSPLLYAADDNDPVLAFNARAALKNLHNQRAVDVFCEAWVKERSPLLTEILRSSAYVASQPIENQVLTALKLGKVELLLAEDSEIIDTLIAANADSDIEIAGNAYYCLINLQNHEAIDRLCQIWCETRQAQLEKALLQAKYVANRPLDVKILTALKVHRLGIAENAPPKGLPYLLQAAEDEDEGNKANALTALSRLKKAETREALCQLVVDQDPPLAHQIALQAGYLPQTPEKQVLFLFLTEQWSKYDALDFDRRMMQAVYEAARPDLRQRILNKIQSSGKPDLLAILTGLNITERSTTSTPNENNLLIRILRENQQWMQLWKLTFELPLPFAVEIIHILEQENWLSEDEATRNIFSEVAALAAKPMALESAELGRLIPPAAAREHLRFSGRINDIAFSPLEPVLAIGTGRGQVVFWNYKSGKIDNILKNFNHAIGILSYTQNGRLVVAERSQPNNLCGIYIWEGEEIFRLGEHRGAISALIPAGKSEILSTGRDNRCALWDIDNRRLIAENKFNFWPRTACITPDNYKAALVHKHVSLVELADLSLVSINGKGPVKIKAGASANRRAAFSPNACDILLGKIDGSIALLKDTVNLKGVKRSIILQHKKMIEALEFLNKHSLLISASHDGELRFSQWPELSTIGSVTNPGGNLLSMELSRDEAYMATGSEESQIVLWDLRLLDLPDLINQPLAHITPVNLAGLTSLIESGQLPDLAQNTFMLLRRLIQHRFQYDIQVEEIPVMPKGEFDIIIDE